MALIAAHVRVTALERPAREPVIEAVLVAARPADLRRVPTDVLDVASAAVAALVLAAVQALACTDPPGELRVTAEAGRGAHPASLRMASVALVVALEIRVVAREGAGREELGFGLPFRGDERAEEPRDDVRRDDEGERPPLRCQSDQIHRYP